MQVLLGLHGIWQRRTSAERLSRDWSRALLRGLAAKEYAGEQPKVVVPHIAPLLTDAHSRLGAEDSVAGLDDAPLAERKFVRAGLDEFLENAIQNEPHGDAETLGIPAVPKSVSGRLLEVDRRWPGLGLSLVRLLREVYSYLFYPGVRARVQRRVCSSASDASILIAHSLGSVIAYDMLHDGKPSSVKRLITCGSPLAWSTIREHLPAAPLDNYAWVNLHDLKDPITGGRRLGDIWPCVLDMQVSNSRGDSHGIREYLEQELMGVVVSEALASESQQSKGSQ
jgi:hypothetical protein